MVATALTVIHNDVNILSIWISFLFHQFTSGPKVEWFVNQSWYGFMLCCRFQWLRFVAKEEKTQQHLMVCHTSIPLKIILALLTNYQWKQWLIESIFKINFAQHFLHTKWIQKKRFNQKSLILIQKPAKWRAKIGELTQNRKNMLKIPLF